MLLTVLGSGTCELRVERSSPAYLVEAGGTRVMLDLGQGAWRRLLESGRAAVDINGVIISHPHLDHTADLLSLLFALKYDPQLSANARMTLLAHPGVGRILEGLNAVFGSWLQAPEPALTRRWLAPGQRAELGSVAILAEAAVHQPHSLAWRLEADGCSLVYLGDSEASQELAVFAANADLLICHCAGSDEARKEGHLYPAGCGELAARAQVKALLLSHFYRAVDPAGATASARARFAGPVWAAFDGLALELGPGGAAAQEVKV